MILFTHHTGEPHGILGAQVAATFFERKLSIPSIVVGIERDFSKEGLLRFIDEYYTGKERMAAFSHLCGKQDIIDVARELKQEGFTTLLGGPQARQDVKSMFASIGFESFCDRLLHFLCKGISVADIVKCVETLRRLKDEFGNHLLYRRDEGANHGFIRPTPWDDGETMQEMDRNIFLHRFFEDILPEHSIPLIIHHASYLGDWIRKIELTAGITFRRTGTWIEW